MMHTAPLSKLQGPIPANTKQLYNICTMLGQCRRRWTYVAGICHANEYQIRLNWARRTSRGYRDESGDTVL